MAVAKKDKSPKEIDYDKIDIMNRSEWVDKVYNLIESLPLNNKGASFAIDGKWGSGKTFVLNMLTEKLESEVVDTEKAKNKKSDRKYLVFNYNAWENDYYDEPLLSIVSVMVDELNAISNGKNKVNAAVKTYCKEVANIFGVVLNQISKEVIKVDFKAIVKEVKEKYTDVKNSYEKTLKEFKISNDFDTNTGFKLALNMVKSAIEKLTEHFTIVFIVDELDRCMPEYAIKVMERTHHIFNKEKKTVQILSVDKSQLAKSIMEIFGADVVVEDYLDKFITFSVYLTDDVMTEKFNEKFIEIISNYNVPDKFIGVDFVEVINPILEHLNIRKRKQVLDKIVLIHRYAIKEKSCISVFIYEVLYYMRLIYQEKKCNTQDENGLYDYICGVISLIYGAEESRGQSSRDDYFFYINEETDRTHSSCKYVFNSYHTQAEGLDGLKNIIFYYFNYSKFNLEKEEYETWTLEEARNLVNRIPTKVTYTADTEGIEEYYGHCLLFHEACKLIN